MRWGEVVEFDEPAGFGTIRTTDDADAAFFFHCTAITDGTRSIAVGTRVAFEVVPGRRGRWEAAEIRPSDGPG